MMRIVIVQMDDGKYEISMSESKVSKSNTSMIDTIKKKPLNTDTLKCYGSLLSEVEQFIQANRRKTNEQHTDKI